MKFFLFTIFLLLIPWPVFAQAGSDQPLEELPTIVVRGEDRSYLEIVREKEISYMPSRGEKKTPQSIYEAELPPRERLPAEFPVLFLPLPEISAPPERKEPGPSAAPGAYLSQRYIREARAEMQPPLVRAHLPVPRKTLAQKEALPAQIKIEVSLSPKETHFAGFKPLEEKIEVVQLKKRGEILPSTPPTPFLSQLYTKQVKVSPAVREGIFLPRKSLGVKQIIQPPLYVSVPRKVMTEPFFPKIGLKLPEISPLPSREEVRPRIYSVSLTRQYLPDSPGLPGQEKVSLVKRPAERVKEEKTLSKIPLEIPPVTRIYYPEQIKKSDYPYLHFLVGVGGYRNFNYQFDYGREKENRRYLLSLDRKSFPRWVMYQGTNFNKERDIMQGGISWGGPDINETHLAIQGSQNRLELPATGDAVGERVDTQVSLDFGQTRMFNHWDWNIWGEKVTRDDKGNVEEKWDDLSYGASLAFYTDNFPFTIQGIADWENLRKGKEATLLRNKYQILIQAVSTHPFSLGKSFFLDMGLGVKGLKEEKKAEGVGFFKLSWYGKEEHFGATLQTERKFYLPGFSDLYLSQDYSRIDPEIGPVDKMDYSLTLNYRNLPWINFSLKGFIEEGEDAVWVYHNLPDAHLYPEIIKLSRQGWKATLSWQIIPAVTLEPSYGWKTLKNKEYSGAVIPQEAQSSGEVLLRIKAGEWILETTGEWLGKRYFTYSSSDKLPSASRIKAKLTYQKESWEAFIEMENNNEYFLTEDYQFPRDRLTLGVKLKLF